MVEDEDFPCALYVVRSLANVLEVELNCQRDIFRSSQLRAAAEITIADENEEQFEEVDDTPLSELCRQI